MKTTLTIAACSALLTGAVQAQIMSYIDFEDQTVGSSIDFIDENGNFWFSFAATAAELPRGSADIPGADIRKGEAPATTVAGDFSPGFGYLEVEGDAFEFAGTSWTLECFVKFADTGGWQTILGRDPDLLGPTTPAADVYFSKHFNNRFRFEYRTGWTDNGDGTFTDNRAEVWSHTIAATPDRWYHIGVTYDQDTRTMTLYINGEIDDQITDVDNVIAVTDPFSQFWSVGRGYWDGNAVDSLNAVIDDLRITAAVLSPSEMLVATECFYDRDGDGDSDTADILQYIGELEAGCN
ncbi:MAG: LamG domain-containing protein [Phycisphaeraceae bacterium]|nr:MAG: LamG domain-containing protein [Phycisphaeraceae bacterium]